MVECGLCGDALLWLLNIMSPHKHTPTQTLTCFRISPCKPIHHCSSCSQFIFVHIHYSGAAGHQFIHTEMPENLRSICSTGWFFVFRLFTPPRVRRATDEIWLFRFRMPLIGYGEWIMSSGCVAVWRQWWCDLIWWNKKLIYEWLTRMDGFGVCGRCANWW